MHKQFFATSMIVLALVFSQTSTLFIAAFCPHLTSKAQSCDVPAAPAESAHDEMGHSQTTLTQLQSNETTDTNAAAVAEPRTSCKHCALHSRTSPINGSVGEWSIPQRSSGLTISLPVAKIETVPSVPLAVVPSRAHGPPGNEISRHVLINVFRI